MRLRFNRLETIITDKKAQLFKSAKNSGKIDLTHMARDYRQGTFPDYMWEGHLAPMWERCPSVIG